jgi:tetratricopeptide (TPR) repeat protein
VIVVTKLNVAKMPVGSEIVFIGIVAAVRGGRSMLVQPAEESFQKGMRAFESGRGTEAMAFFEAAIELERRLGEGKPQARYLSQYGLCLGTVMKRRHEGVRFCREAAELERYNPDVHCNLGRVLMVAGRRKDAHAAFVRGLSIQPDHRGIRKALKEMGVRKRPVLPFLHRDNRLNILLGKRRARRG